eukprot:5641762-Prorocentrum_lima.AAC.1
MVVCVYLCSRGKTLPPSSQDPQACRRVLPNPNHNPRASRREIPVSAPSKLQPPPIVHQPVAGTSPPSSTSPIREPLPA